MKEPTPDVSKYGPRDRLTLLETLKGSPGFRIYLAQVGRMIERDIDEKIFDVKTPDAEARILRETRARLAESYSPLRVIDAAITAARSEIQQQERDAK